MRGKHFQTVSRCFPLGIIEYRSHGDHLTSICSERPTLRVMSLLHTPPFGVSSEGVTRGVIRQGSGGLAGVFGSRCVGLLSCPSSVAAAAAAASSCGSLLLNRLLVLRAAGFFG